MQGKYKHREQNANSFNSSIDIIEYVRGQFSSLSYINDITAREVHVLQIRKTFERAGLENKLRFCTQGARLNARSAEFE